MFKKELHDAVVQFVESKYPAMYAKLLNMLNTDARRRLPPFLEKATERYRYQIRVVKEAEVLQIQGEYCSLTEELKKAITEYLAHSQYMETAVRGKYRLLREKRL